MSITSHFNTKFSQFLIKLRDPWAPGTSFGYMHFSFNTNLITNSTFQNVRNGDSYLVIKPQHRPNSLDQEKQKLIQNRCSLRFHENCSTANTRISKVGWNFEPEKEQHIIYDTVTDVDQIPVYCKNVYCKLRKYLDPYCDF